MAVSCIGGGKRCTRRKPPTCHWFLYLFVHLMIIGVTWLHINFICIQFIKLCIENLLKAFLLTAIFIHNKIFGLILVNVHTVLLWYCSSFIVGYYLVTVGSNWRKRWEFKLMLRCHCACSTEIGTCIINDARRQAAHKNNENMPTLLSWFFS
jgi:hypothetical protein